jgi:nucleoside-diphosphate-sugar epimerase
LSSTTSPTKILLIGSGFLASSIFVRLCSHENTHVIVMDRRDPTTITFFNQDTKNIFTKYCRKYQYADSFTGKEFGDPKRNIKISFLMKDYVSEPVHSTAQEASLLSDVNLVVYAGAIYDSVFSLHNPNETDRVNIQGITNLVRNYVPNIGNPIFIHMSSLNVYGDQSEFSGAEITEDSTTPNPRDVLNLSLYQQENIIRASLDKWMIFRLGTLMGEFTPISSLCTAAVAAMLMKQKVFHVSNYHNSIELLDINDFGLLIYDLVGRVKSGKINDGQINQIYNIKCDEKEPKTVGGIVKSIYSLTKLPSITTEHKLKGMAGYRIKVPEVVVQGYGDKLINFNEKTVSREKSFNKLGFSCNNPIVYSMLRGTVSYLLNYVLTGFSPEELEAIRKILYLASVPHPDYLDENEDVNKDVKDLVKDVNKAITEGFENQ